eukprot:195131-Amphidinium_carterae.1
MGEEGGVLFPEDSLPGKELEKYATELWCKHKKLAIPLYQENAQLACETECGPQCDFYGSRRCGAPFVGGQPASSAGQLRNTAAKVLKGPEQATAAEIEQHEAQGHLP